MGNTLLYLLLLLAVIMLFVVIDVAAYSYLSELEERKGPGGVENWKATVEGQTARKPLGAIWVCLVRRWNARKT